MMTMMTSEWIHFVCVYVSVCVCLHVFVVVLCVVRLLYISLLLYLSGSLTGTSACSPLTLLLPLVTGTSAFSLLTLLLATVIMHRLKSVRRCWKLSGIHSPSEINFARNGWSGPELICENVPGAGSCCDTVLVRPEHTVPCPSLVPITHLMILFLNTT